MESKLGLEFLVRFVISPDDSQTNADTLHVCADWVLRDLRRACVRLLYLIAVERLARIVESLKRAGERVIEEWPFANE